MEKSEELLNQICAQYDALLRPKVAKTRSMTLVIQGRRCGTMDPIDSPTGMIEKVEYLPLNKSMLQISNQDFPADYDINGLEVRIKMTSLDRGEIAH